MGGMKRVALGVTGGIAAYKAAEITRLLQDCGVRVQVVMTRSAQEFVRPLTFAALTGQKVITGLFGPEGAESVPNVDSAVEHRQRHRRRFPDHALPRYQGSRDRRTGDEREHVGAPGDTGESH